MKLKDKLFTMRDDQPYLNPVGIAIPEFKELWSSDKTVDKSQYAKELAYVYHMCEYESPYYDSSNKSDSIAKDFLGVTGIYKAPKRVTDCMNAYNRLQSNAEKRALDAATISCSMIGEDLKKVEMESDEFNKLVKEIDTAIKNEKDLKVKIILMTQRLELQKNKFDNNKSITGLVSNIEKQVESIKNLREKVTKAVYTGEMSQELERFLIDDILDELRDGR